MSNYCEICHGVGYHKSTCPNYVEVKSPFTCEFCHDPILVGETYVTDNSGHYAHYECMSTDQLVEFLDGKIGIMEVDDE